MLLKMSPDKATPTAMPRFRDAATVPDATPLWAWGIALMTVELLGEIKIPMPIPIRARGHAIEIYPCVGVIRDRKNKAIDISSIPRVQSMRDPVRSEM